MDPASPPTASPTRHALTVPVDAVGLRLDQALAQLLPQHSRSRLKGWIEAGQVTVNAMAATEPSSRLRGGEAVGGEAGSMGRL